MKLHPFALLAIASCASTRPAAPAVNPGAPSSPSPSLSGVWLGTLHAGPQDLRLQLHLDLEKTPAGCSLDSLDQRGFGIPCSNVIVSATKLSLDVPSVRGSLAGTVSSDGKTISGTWSQGAANDLDIVLTRQAKAIERGPR
jgi:hypothetical protein